MSTWKNAAPVNRTKRKTSESASAATTSPGFTSRKHLDVSGSRPSGVRKGTTGVEYSAAAVNQNHVADCDALRCARLWIGRRVGSQDSILSRDRAPGSGRSSGASDAKGICRSDRGWTDGCRALHARARSQQQFENGYSALLAPLETCRCLDRSWHDPAHFCHRHELVGDRRTSLTLHQSFRIASERYQSLRHCLPPIRTAL